MQYHESGEDFIWKIHPYSEQLYAPSMISYQKNTIWSSMIETTFLKLSVSKLNGVADPHLLYVSSCLVRHLVSAICLPFLAVFIREM